MDTKFFRATPLKSINLVGETYRIDLVEARGQYQKSYAVLKIGANPPVGLLAMVFLITTLVLLQTF